MKTLSLAAFSFMLAFVARADALSMLVDEATGPDPNRMMTVSADRIAADRNTQALMATGHVVAVSGPVRLHADFLERDTNGVCRMSHDTSLTTCTNCPGHLHWEIKGDIEYQDGHHILLRNATLRLWEVPVFWFPYFYYPSGGDFAVEVMPGYTSRWGAYLMTKYNYTLVGDPSLGSDGRWLSGNTRLDLRWENGVALGETLRWSLGNWGQGKFKIYYAWDKDYERHGVNTGSGGGGYNDMNWGSTVPYNRYGIQLEHRIDVTERDIVRGKMSLFSDTFFQSDFLRSASFSIKNDLYGFVGNELAWEHNENLWGLGVSVSGPLNDFVGGTARLPEVYFDLAPTPLWNLPINYETENRIGYLKRQAARYEGATSPVFGSNPGVWADYDTMRFDTYHRLTAPFKTWDVLSVVPRLGYHGTYWNKTGNTVVGGLLPAESNKDNAIRSIIEGGITFSGRGTAWLSEKWQHMIEPYTDVLAQQAIYSGLGSNHRPYIFDSIDASSDWSDQFAGRSRNLPYTWYGVTPGVRNTLRAADDRGNLRTIFDLDVYAALQFNSTEWIGDNDSHKLAEDPAKPNYGKGHCLPIPGARLKWEPFDGASMGGRIEYDSENVKIAQSEIFWMHRLNRDFRYRVAYYGRDHRYWDYSSSPVSSSGDFDGFNWVKFNFIHLEFTHEVCDAFAWSPYIRWDCRLGELDEVGAWIDIYRTDCIGFRLNLAYENEYTRVDGSREEQDYRIGFYIYLRALGPSKSLQIGD